MTWGNQNTDEEAAEQLNTAWDAGVSFLDTANPSPGPNPKPKPAPYPSSKPAPNPSPKPAPNPNPNLNPNPNPSPNSSPSPKPNPHTDQVNFLDTAEGYPVPMTAERQGATDLAIGR